MQQGITKCEWCLNQCDNEDLKCPNCGGPILVLEPWVLQCGWCSNSNRRDLTLNCTNCGGVLPHIPGTPRLPEPPHSPRNIPKGYENRIRYWKNVHFIIGAIFMLFLPTIIFPIIGFFLLRYGIKRGNNQIFALKYGVPTRGIIKDVYVDTTQSINDVHPIRLNYTFSTSNKEKESFIVSWDNSNLRRPEGEHLWVLFNPNNIEQNSIWPPLW